MLDGNVIDIYAVLDARQDPQAIDAILDSPRTKRCTEVLDRLFPDGRVTYSHSVIAER